MSDKVEAARNGITIAVQLLDAGEGLYSFHGEPHPHLGRYRCVACLRGREEAHVKNCPVAEIEKALKVIDSE